MKPSIAGKVAESSEGKILKKGYANTKVRLSGFPTNTALVVGMVNKRRNRIPRFPNTLTGILSEDSQT